MGPILRRPFAWIWGVTMTACATGSAPVPALWSGPSAACVAEAQAFATVVTQRHVTLHAAAFEHDAVLVLDTVAPRDAQGRPFDGRRRDVQGGTFQLEMRGSACVMVHPASGRSQALPACRCTPR